MKHQIARKLFHAAELIELLIGIAVLLLTITCGVCMVLPIDGLEEIGNATFFREQLSEAAYLIIGVEFIKMITSYRVDSVLDIMALAIAREMISHETSPMENLFCVISIAVLFFTRRYLNIHTQHAQEHPAEQAHVD